MRLFSTILSLGILTTTAALAGCSSSSSTTDNPTGAGGSDLGGASGAGGSGLGGSPGVGGAAGKGASGASGKGGSGTGGSSSAGASGKGGSGTGGSSPAGASGASGASGKGGSSTGGSGGSGTSGSGGSGTSGSGGSGTSGSGGSGTSGSGGSGTSGSGGSGTSGSGGSGTSGSGGSDTAGNGGAAGDAGSGGSDTAGNGGAAGNSGSGGAAAGNGGASGASGSSSGSGGASGSGGGLGATCALASDCSSNGTLVCDPTTAKCSIPECTAQSPNCGMTSLCLTQDMSSNGACYVSCTPFSSSCAPGFSCLPVTPDLGTGACYKTGPSAIGESCTPSDISNGCAAGAGCVADLGQNTCRAECSYYSSNPGCSLSERCLFSGVCSAESGDSAAIGQNCSGSSMAGDRCGNDGKAWRGTCLSPGGACTQICRVNKKDCPGTQTCNAVSSPTEAGLGLCQSPQGCSAMAKAACDSCCGTTFPAGDTSANNLFAQACGCQVGSTCSAVCTTNYCAGQPIDAACTTCLNAITSADPCVSQYSSACSANTDCTSYVGCLKQCPAQ